jgi:purine-cytosine permease-like protein
MLLLLDWEISLIDVLECQHVVYLHLCYRHHLLVVLIHYLVILCWIAHSCLKTRWSLHPGLHLHQIDAILLAITANNSWLYIVADWRDKGCANS